MLIARFLACTPATIGKFDARCVAHQHRFERVRCARELLSKRGGRVLGHAGVWAVWGLSVGGGIRGSGEVEVGLSLSAVSGFCDRSRVRVIASHHPMPQHSNTRLVVNSSLPHHRSPSRPELRFVESAAGRMLLLPLSTRATTVNRSPWTAAPPLGWRELQCVSFSAPPRRGRCGARMGCRAGYMVQGGA